MPSRRRGRLPPSTSFTHIFDGVSTLVQRQIVEQALIPFLDTIPNKDAHRVIVKARNIARKSKNIIDLDLAAKKIEVNGLLDELAKDARVPTRSCASDYETLLREVVESISEWLSDMWSLTHEFGLDFLRAHSCLLFSMGVLDHVHGMKAGGCQCIFRSVYVPVTIRDSSGNIVKEFSELGTSNVEAAILWVWREVFLSLLASNNPTFVKLIPELLAEIDDIIGWNGIERLVLGGLTYKQHLFEKLKSTPQHHDHPSCSRCGDVVPSNLDSNYDKEDMFYEDHWDRKLARCVPQFRRLLQDRMIEIFKASPCVDLFRALIVFVTDDAIIIELHGILSRLATTSATFLSTAITIYALEDCPAEIAALLDTHAFLLRVRDYNSLEAAVRTLARSLFSSHREKALQIAEKELLDTMQCLRHSLQPSFSRIDFPAQCRELARIMKMRRGSTERRERIEAWVEAAATPGGPANPMVLAAMMMGLPVPAGLDGTDGAEGLGFLDLDPHDPDFLELCEEHRPDLMARFNRWLDALEVMDCGLEVLENVYKRMYLMMPWIVGLDIVEVMIGRLADRPSKHHICDALWSLATFAKAQRKKRRKKTTTPVEGISGSPSGSGNGLLSSSVPSLLSASTSPVPTHSQQDSGSGSETTGVLSINGYGALDGTGLEDNEGGLDDQDGDEYDSETSDSDPDPDSDVDGVDPDLPDPTSPSFGSVPGGIEDLD